MNYIIYVVKNDIVIGKVDTLNITYSLDSFINIKQRYCIYDCKDFEINLKSINQHDKDCLFNNQEFKFQFFLYITGENVKISEDFNIIERDNIKILKGPLIFSKPINMYILKEDIFILDNIECTFFKYY